MPPVVATHEYDETDLKSRALNAEKSLSIEL